MAQDSKKYRQTELQISSDDPISIQKEKYRQLMGEGIFRLSVGIKNADDINADIRKA